MSAKERKMAQNAQKTASVQELQTTNLYRANGHGRSGGQTAGGDPKNFSRLKQPLFAVSALRELESACRVSLL